MATVEIISDPIGSQFTQAIGMDDPADLNDFSIYLQWSESVSGLEMSDVQVSTGSVVAFEGENAVYRATIRPPETAATLTVTLAENVVNEDNPEATLDIRVSTVFPDADADAATQLIGLSGGTYNEPKGIAVSPTRIYVSRVVAANRILYAFTHDGTEQISEELTLASGHQHTLDYFNGELLSSNNTTSTVSRFSPITDTETATYPLVGASVHTRLGILGFNGASAFQVLPYAYEDATDRYDIDALITSGINATGNRISHQNDLLYLFFNSTSGTDFFGLARITPDNEIEFIKRLNIDTVLGQVDQVEDIAVYRDTLYILRSPTTPQLAVHTLDIKKYRPLSVNTKTNIPVQFIAEGGTLDTTLFCPDAERVIWDTGFDLPDYLSLNASNVLSVDADAVTETTPVLVQLRGLNRIGSQAFSFYLVIQDPTPRWREFNNLTMRAGSSFDLFQIVENADRIAVHPNYTLPTGSTLSNGVFTIGTTGGEVGFRAFNDKTRRYADMDNSVGSF